MSTYEMVTLATLIGVPAGFILGAVGAWLVARRMAALW